MGEVGLVNESATPDATLQFLFGDDGPSGL
jgi:hypothetical protein